MDLAVVHTAGAILGILFSCGAWIDRQSYDIDEDVYKPDTPWKQTIWKASVAELSSLELRVMRLRRH